MNRFTVIFLSSVFIALPAWAAEADVQAEAGVQAETEEGLFSRGWNNFKGFFGFNGEEQPVEEQAAAEPQTKPETVAEDDSLIDKAAESTKAGVDWTADKAKKGAEWTKETAVNVKDDAVGGAKAVGGAVKEGAGKVGGAVKDVFTSDSKVEAEATVEAD